MCPNGIDILRQYNFTLNFVHGNHECWVGLYFINSKDLCPSRYIIIDWIVSLDSSYIFIQFFLLELSYLVLFFLEKSSVPPHSEKDPNGSFFFKWYGHVTNKYCKKEIQWEPSTGMKIITNFWGNEGKQSMWIKWRSCK